MISVSPQLYAAYIADRLEKAKKEVLDVQERFRQHHEKVVRMGLVARLVHRLFNQPITNKHLDGAIQKVIMLERQMDTARVLQHDVKLKSEEEDYKEWFNSRYPEQRHKKETA